MKNLKLLLLTLLVALSVNLQAQREHELFAKDGHFWEVCLSSYGNGVSVVAVMATSLDLKIPDSLKYDGVTYPVISIAEAPPKILRHAFKDIETISFPKDLRVIGDSAFKGSTSLVELDFSRAHNIAVGNSAFENCTELSQISFSQRIGTIGNSAFENCTKLSQFSFPKEIETIGNSAFENCTKLSQISFPNSLAGIGNSAFKNCTSLEILDLFHVHSDDMVIGNSAFENCTSLRIIELSVADRMKVGNSAFKDCTKLSQINFPESLYDIGNSAFKNCTSLENLNLSLVLTDDIGIGDSAFENCTKLSQIRFPKKMNSIGNSAFKKCTSLENLDLSHVLTDGMWVGNSAFKDCTKLNQISFPKNISEIGDSAFANCISNFSLTAEHIGSIGSYAFLNSGITSMKISDPISFSSNDKGIFKSATQLDSLFLFSDYFPPEFATSCRDLHYVSSLLDQNYTVSVDSFAFESAGIDSIKCTLQDVSYAGFKSSGGLKYINKIYGKIESYAFDGCSLKQIEFLSPTSVGEYAIGTDGLIFEPAELYDPDKKTDKSFYDLSNCRKIGSFAFSSNGLKTFKDVELYECEIDSFAFNKQNFFLDYKKVESNEYPCTITLRNCTFVGPSQFELEDLTRLKMDTRTLLHFKAENIQNKPEKIFFEHIDAPLHVSEIPDSFMLNTPFLKGELEMGTLTHVGTDAFRNCGLTLSPSFSYTCSIGKRAFQMTPNFIGVAEIPKEYESPSVLIQDMPFIASSAYTFDFKNIPDFFTLGGYNEEKRTGDINWTSFDHYDLDNPDNNYFYEYPQSEFSKKTTTIDASNCTRITVLPSFEGDFSPIFSRYPDDNQLKNFKNLPINALVYLPSAEEISVNSIRNLYTFDDYFGEPIINEMSASPISNFIMDGKCKHFFVDETLSYSVPEPFTAQTAAYSRTFNPERPLNTLYLPYPTDLPSGMCAYTLVKKNTHKDGEKAFVFRTVPEGTRLEANTPYLLQITDGQSHTLPVMHNVEVPATPGNRNQHLGLETQDWAFVGSTEWLPENYIAGNYMLSAITGKWQKKELAPLGYHITYDNMEYLNGLYPFRCFITSPTGASDSRSFLMVLEGDDDSNVTGIKELENTTEQDIHSGKYPFYSIDGKLMGKDYNKLEQGKLYIVNGKKFYKI